MGRWREIDMPTRAIGVGIIGCGAIGGTLARALDEGLAGSTALKALFDRSLERAKALASSLLGKPKVVASFEELLDLADVELIVEAASHQAVREYGLRILESGRDMMLMSVGAFVDPMLLAALKAAAEKGRRRIYLPSGAIGGLDALKAAALGRLEEVTLTIRKPPAALRASNDSVKSLGFDLGAIRTPTVLYEGPAAEACRLFPPQREHRGHHKHSRPRAGKDEGARGS